jgi:hypothetical protein
VPGYELYFAICYIFLIILLGMFSVHRVTFNCFTVFIVAVCFFFFFFFFIYIISPDCKDLAITGVFQCDYEYLYKT